MINDQFWNQVRLALDAASGARTADELIAAVKRGPNQDHGDRGAQAFFAGSGGDPQLADVLAESDHWEITWVEGDYWWKATALADGSIIEYVEGDLYVREPK